MAQLLDHVEPGQIITAQHWNLVVDAVNELLQSGQTNGIKITASSPEGTIIDPIRIGTMVQIVGQNFGYSIGQSKVTFEAGGTTVTVLRADMLAGSWDERLLFMMPVVPGITNDGMTMTMRVSNGVADDTRSVLVKPVVIDLTGDMFVTWRPIVPNPKPNPLESGVGKSAEFAYNLQTGTNLPASFDLSVDILNPSVTLPGGFVNSIEFRDEANNVISGKQVSMGKTESKNIKVRIPEIPSSLANQSFTLKVTAAAGTVKGIDQRPFTVGAAVIPADPNIEASQTGFTLTDNTSGTIDTDPASGSFDGNTIRLKVGKRGTVIFTTKFTKKGKYDVTILPKTGTTLTGWAPEMTADSIGTRSPDHTTVTVDVAGDNDQSTRTEKFKVVPSGSPSASGTLVFRIKRQGETSDWFKEYGVELIT